MDRSQNQVRRVSTEVIEESLGLSRFDEVPTLQIGGLLNNGAVFDIRPGTINRPTPGVQGHPRRDVGLQRLTAPPPTESHLSLSMMLL